jgi:peptidoglycan L-alanyl-D-glutamate endopeptidase CwlK
MAIDLGLFRGGSYLDGDDPNTARDVYRAIGSVVKLYGIEWGGTWRSFPDAPHFQIDQGRSSPNAKDQAALAAGTWAPIQ